MNPLVSVIIPSYKRNKTLVKRAIESVFAQTYDNTEVILVDDNAGDLLSEYRNELSELANEYAGYKFNYIQNDVNLGGAISRNAGIEKSNGEFITFLDDDDRYLEDKIANQIEFMQANQLEASFTDLAMYNENENLIDYRKHNDIKSFDNDYLLKYHLTKQITGTPTFMFQRQILLNVGGFDDVKMGQEYYLMLKIIKSGAKLGYLGRCDIVAYRTNAEAISTGKNKISGEKALYEFKKSNFGILSLWQRSYVRCRHFAVMAVAYKRNSMYGKMITSLIRSVFSNPLIVISEGFIYIKKIITKR